MWNNGRLKITIQSIYYHGYFLGELFKRKVLTKVEHFIAVEPPEINNADSSNGLMKNLVVSYDTKCHETVEHRKKIPYI